MNRKRIANVVDKRKKKIAKQTEKWVSTPNDPADWETRKYLTVEDARPYVSDAIMYSWFRKHIGIPDLWLRDRVLDHLPMAFIHDEAAKEMDKVLQHTVRNSNHPELLRVGRERYFQKQTQIHDDRTEAFRTLELLHSWNIIQAKSLCKWSVSLSKHNYVLERSNEFVHVFTRSTHSRPYLKYVIGRFYLPYQLLSEQCHANLAKIIIEYAYNMKCVFTDGLLQGYELAVF